jgi:hypothetical protein
MHQYQEAAKSQFNGLNQRDQLMNSSPLAGAGSERPAGMHIANLAHCHERMYVLRDRLAKLVHALGAQGHLPAVNKLDLPPKTTSPEPSIVSALTEFPVIHEARVQECHDLITAIEQALL